MDESLRILLEAQPDHLNKQILSGLQQIEADAERIRTEDEQTGRRRIVQDELRDKAETLRSAVAAARAQTIGVIDEQFDQARLEYEKARDKKPDLDVARLRRASNAVNAMSDEQVKNAAFQYGNGDLSLDPYELNEIRARLRTIDEGAELKGFNDAVAIRRDDAPWVSQNAELAQLADYQDVLKQLKDDEIVLIDENAPANQPEQFSRIRAKASELIDFDNRLGQPVE